MIEPESDRKSSRNARASDGESGSGATMVGSGDMGSGSTSTPTHDVDDGDQSSNLSGLEEWQIGLISFGALSLVFCCIFTIMVSPSIATSLSYILSYYSL